MDKGWSNAFTDDHGPGGIETLAASDLADNQGKGSLMAQHARHEVDRDGYVRDRAVMAIARKLLPAYDHRPVDVQAGAVSSAGIAIDALLGAGYTILAPEGQS